MVFSSINPAYNLDPSNWQQQQQNHQNVIGSTSTSPFLPPQSAPPPVSSHGGGGPVLIRPGSMSERARLSNIPVPESALKCPRCDSINTKFCYFNNYSFSQPRHFCKTCRRYWTRGGALRSVPVGGGCRRNKRSKPASSKSTGGSDRTQTTSNSTSSPAGFMPLLPPLRFTSPMNQPTGNFSAHDMGSNYTTIPASTTDTNEINFQFGSIFGGVAGSFSSSTGGGINEPWRLQQTPFLGGLDPSSPEMYQFQGSETGHLVRPRLSSSILTQMGSVLKTEENLKLKGQLTEGIMPRIKDNQWNGASSSWTELSNYRIPTSK